MNARSADGVNKPPPAHNCTTNQSSVPRQTTRTERPKRQNRLLSETRATTRCSSTARSSSISAGPPKQPKPKSTTTRRHLIRTSRSLALCAASWSGPNAQSASSDSRPEPVPPATAPDSTFPRDSIEIANYITTRREDKTPASHRSHRSNCSISQLYATCLTSIRLNQPK